MAEGAVIVGDFTYTDRIRTRGAAQPQDRFFAEPAPFKVPGADAAEIPVAIECEIVASHGDDPIPFAYRLGPTGYLAPTGAPDALASRNMRRVALPYEPKSFPHGAIRACDAFHLKHYGVYERAKVIASGRDAGLARAAEAAAASRILDRVVWAPSPAPVLIVRSWGSVPDLRVVAIPGGTQAFDREPRFHIEDAEAALDHARWLSTRTTGNNHGRPTVPASPIRVLVAPDRAEFRMGEARRLAERLLSREWPKDFAALPLGMMEDWVAFRRGVAGMEAGRHEAVDEAFRALGRLLDRTPAELPRTFVDMPATAMLRYELEEPVRYWRAYLSRMNPAPAESLGDDGAAMAGLAPR